jgi:hypothetical protein
LIGDLAHPPIEVPSSAAQLMMKSCPAMALRMT